MCRLVIGSTDGAYIILRSSGEEPGNSKYHERFRVQGLGLLLDFMAFTEDPGLFSAHRIASRGDSSPRSKARRPLYKRSLPSEASKGGKKVGGIKDP